MAKTPIKSSYKSANSGSKSVYYGAAKNSGKSSTRARNIGRRRQIAHNRSKSSNYYSSSDECIDDSGSAFMDDARLQHAYYAMVVQTQYGEWRYVTISDHAMGTATTPILFAASSLDKLMALWTRAVVHNAIPWHDNVAPHTLRIISYSMDIQEVTEKVFGEDYAHQRKTAALMMIEDKDARMLGLTESKAKQVLFHQPDFEDDDEHLMKQLKKESTSHAVDNLLVLD